MGGGQQESALETLGCSPLGQRDLTRDQRDRQTDMLTDSVGEE